MKAMNQKLFKQMKNEWRSNLWLALELLIVSVVMWYIVDYLYSEYRVYREPLGFDVEHCYKIEVSDLNEKSSDFIADATSEDYESWRNMLMERLRNRPEIEVVGRGQNSHPYQGSNSGTWLKYDTVETSGYVLCRIVTPDFVKVFRYTGSNGETSEELAEILNKGEVLISDNLFSMDERIKNVKPADLVGKNVYLNWDTTRTFTVGAVLNTVKYSDFMQGQMNRTIVIPERAFINYGTNEWVVRVKDNMDKDFEKNLRADIDRLFRVGNMYVSNIKSFTDIRRNYLTEDKNTIRNMVTGMGFLLLNIFLGLLGTFWFRTQQRTRDIAVRKVSGATSGDIFRLLIGEGLLLLTVVTPLALAIDINIAHFELNSYYGGYFEWGRMLLCVAVTYLIMALMIVTGIAVPAYRAMRITPATALRDE